MKTNKDIYTPDEIKEFLKENNIYHDRYWDIEFRKDYTMLNSFSIEGIHNKKMIRLFNKRFPLIEFRLGKITKESRMVFNTGDSTEILYIYKIPKDKVVARLNELILNVDNLNSKSLRDIMQISLKNT